MNFDIKLYTESGTVGIERKKLPGDFLTSVDDGRLRREIIAMRGECDHQLVLLHGVFRYDRHGQVLDGKRTLRWTRTGIRNIRRTIEWVEGCFIEQAEDDQELIDVIETLQKYLNEKHHFSLKGRPGIQKTWVVPTMEERVIHFYDGIPDIAPVRAKALAARFPSPMELYEASAEDIATMSGFGKQSAIKIYNFLRGV